MTVVLTTSCLLDSELLRYSSRALRAFAEDLEHQVVYCDRADQDVIEDVLDGTGAQVLFNEDLLGEEIARRLPGQLKQRLVKLRAAALLGPHLQLDSDMFLTSTVRLDWLRNTWVCASSSAMSQIQKRRNAVFTRTSRDLLGFGEDESFSLMEGLGWWINPEVAQRVLATIESHTRKPAHEAFLDLWSRSSQPSEYVLYGTWLLNREPTRYFFYDISRKPEHPLHAAIYHHQGKVPSRRTLDWANGVQTPQPEVRQQSWLR